MEWKCILKLDSHGKPDVQHGEPTGQAKLQKSDWAAGRKGIKARKQPANGKEQRSINGSEIGHTTAQVWIPQWKTPLLAQL
jgi:hypothetical protein